MHQSTREIVPIAALWISATEEAIRSNLLHCDLFAQWNTIQWRK